MAAGPLGVNLAGTLGFVDLMKETRAWQPLNGASSLPTDANGWPQADAQIVVLDERVNQSFNGPDPNAVQPDIGGTYHLSFQGQATVTFDFLPNFSVQNPVYNAATNTTTADLVVSHNTPALLIIDFRNTVNPASSTDAGITNVKLIQPGYAADTTQVFSNTFLNDLTPFGTLRYLNVDQANNYYPTTDANNNLVPISWSQRKLPSASSQTSGPGEPGEAWEYMVALANASNTDMWINIPGNVTDDYVTQLANLIKNGDTVNGVTYAGLNSNLKVYIENGNEVWGGSYLPYVVNQYSARQQVAAGNSPLNNDGSTDLNTWSARNYLQRTMQETTIFRGVFGADPTYAKIRPVLGWAEGDYQYYTQTFPWFEKTYGAPSQFFYGMGNANYLDPTDYSSVDNLIGSLYSGLAQEAALTRDYATIANYYGLQTVAYEGGPSTGGAPNGDQAQVALAAARDPRMADFIQQEYDTWYASGGNLAMVYDGPFDNFTPNNQFALLEVAQAGNPTASPKYRGVVQLSQANTQPVTSATTVSPTGTTSLSTASDSLGASFPSFSASQPNDWLLNVPTAGNYSFNIQTGANSSPGQIAISVSDTTSLGTYTLNPGSTYSLVNLPLHAGLNTLAVTTLSPFTPVSLTLAPVTGQMLNDPGFEAAGVHQGNNGYLYNPTGTPWTYAGQAGVSGNKSAFTSGNPSAPQGSQVAFIQSQGSISQLATGFVAGNYHISFSAAQRANYGGTQTLQVLVDGNVVGSFTPSGASYQGLATTPFAVTAGSHMITFQGMNSTVDATAFVDAVSIAQDANTITGNAAISDPGFEQAKLNSGYNGYFYDPTGLAWAFSGTAGVAANATAFTNGNPNAPQGSQVAFLQSSGSVSQSVANFAAANYHLTFAAAQRGNFGATQTFQVLIDGVLVGTFGPLTIAYQNLSTAPFAVTAGTHTVTFQGMNSTSDATALLDAVALVQDSTTSVTGVVVGDSSFETVKVPVGTQGYLYDPSGSPWTFTAQSGVTGNGSAFNSQNPTAPDGSQVAFLQNQGSISQNINVGTAGNYHVSFSAAQRADYGVTQTIQVLLDGAVVGRFTLSSTSYQTLSTVSVALSAGMHSLTFQGTSTNGDATGFIDAVSMTQDTANAISNFADPGFETAQIPTGYRGYTVQPSGTPWTFTGESGVTGNGTAFTNGNPNAPQGVQVAFIQDQGSISQTINGMTAGSYSVAFQILQRSYGSSQSIQLLVDGVVMGTFSPSTTNYQMVNTSAFKLTSGSHTFTFQGMTSPSLDGTAFIDSVALTPQ